MRDHKIRFQRYEVSLRGDVIRTFNKKNRALAIAFATDYSITNATSAVIVDAVSSKGSNGQTTTCVGAFINGEKV